MPTIKTKDGTRTYCKDWVTGGPVVFSHCWPLGADTWEDQKLSLAKRGYRCIAHDRRGQGRSDQPWNSNDMDTYADDLADLVKHLDLKGAGHVARSTGGGEVARSQQLSDHGLNVAVERVLHGQAGVAVSSHDTGQRGDLVPDEHLTDVVRVSDGKIIGIDTYVSDFAMLDAFFA